MLRMRRVILVLAVGFVCFAMALVATAQDAGEKEGYLCVPIKNIDLKPPEGVDAEKNPVSFQHPSHFIYNCKECHHTWNFDAQLQSCSTSGCHDLVKAPTKENAGDAEANIRYFKNAFHQQCIGCHLKLKQQNAIKEKALRISDKNLELAKTGPTGCVECHPSD